MSDKPQIENEIVRSHAEPTPWQDHPAMRHIGGCFNDAPGAVLCQVCGGDMPERSPAVGTPQAGEAVNRFGDTYPTDAAGNPLPYTHAELAEKREYAAKNKGGIDDRYLRTIDALCGLHSQGTLSAADLAGAMVESGAGWVKLQRLSSGATERIHAALSFLAQCNPQEKP